MVKSTDSVDYTVEDEETLATEDETADADDIKEAIDLAIEYEGAAPDPANYGYGFLVFLYLLVMDLMQSVVQTGWRDLSLMVL